MLYLFSTVLSVSIGLGLVNFVGPGNSFSNDKKTELREKYSSKADLKINDALLVESSGPLQLLVDVVPTNIFESASKNKNKLQIIFFAILFGISIIMLPKEKTVYVRGFFDCLFIVTYVNCKLYDCSTSAIFSFNDKGIFL